MARALNNPFALLSDAGDEEVPKQTQLKKQNVPKPKNETLKQQEPPKPKGPIVGSELKEQKQQSKPKPQQTQVAEEKKDSKDAPKEEQFQKVPEKKKGGGEEGQKTQRKKEERFRNRRGEGDKDSQFATGSNRVYERKSGTGRGHEVKKGGAGKGNWGKPGSEIQDINQDIQSAHDHVTEITPKVQLVEVTQEQAAAPAPATPAVATPEATSTSNNTATSGLEQVATTAAPPQENKEENYVSYSEWLTKEKEKTAAPPLPRALRTAGEGIEDTSGWASIEVTRDQDKPVLLGKKKEDKKEKKKN